MGFPGGTSDNELGCQCKRHKRQVFGPWAQKILGGGRGNPLQYSCLENPMTEKSGLQSMESQRIRHD